MRTTITLDDKLIETAKEFSGLEETSAVIREALRALVEREAGRRLILMGGSDPNAEMPRRRRPWDE
jgi:Arc/MetJ family transcription regulator